MTSFVHKSIIGDFFGILETEEGGADSGTVSRLMGETRRKEASISIFSGDFTPETIPEFTALLEDLIIAPVQLIVFDFSRARSFSASATGVLVNFLAGVEGRGKRLVLYRPSRAVLDTLASCGLMLFFEVQQTVEELLLDLPDKDI